MRKSIKKQQSSTDAQILIEFSKECLFEDLRQGDFHSDSIHCVANIYLAILHCTSGHYQTAIENCKLAILRDNHEFCGSHAVLISWFSRTDDLHNIFGLIFLQKYISNVVAVGDNALSQKCESSPTIDTTKVFAQVLHAMISSKCNTVHDSQIQPRRHSERYFNTKNLLIDILVQSSCQHLRLFQLAMADYEVICASVSEYEALYLYNKGRYLSAFDICQVFLSVRVQWRNG